MLEEHDQIVLTSDLPEDGLKAGDVGVIVHIHRQGEAFEVEFLTLDGNTVAIATVLASQVRPVTDRDITHARTMERRRSKRARPIRQDWAGALQNYRDQYTSLDLQKKALEWRGD